MNYRRSAGMNLSKTVARSQTPPDPQAENQSVERCLTLLVEGAALNMPEIDAATYKLFRETVSAKARSIPDRLPESELLPAIKSILQEFEGYRKGADGALRERQAGWRLLAGTLLRELFTTMGIDPGSDAAAALIENVGILSTGHQIQIFRGLLDEFLHPTGDGSRRAGSRFRVADHSTANDNAAGLRGGGAAQEQFKTLLERGASGYVVAFRLNCLDVIGERFGLEAVHDSLMAVAAFLTHSLRGSDTVYHWSDSSLLAMLESDATEQMLVVAMQRIVNSNRDTTIIIDGRNVMLRIPLTFEITPFSHFRSADDLLKLSRQPVPGR
jgi:GGDEF domain-containing protein